MNRIIAALAALALAAVMPLAAVAQSAPVLGPLTFTTTTNNAALLTVPLNTGVSYCTITTYAIGNGTINLTSSGDDGQTFATATGINGGSITTVGQVSGSANVAGNTTLRLGVSGLSSGSVSGVVACGPTPPGGFGFAHYPATAVTAGTANVICANACVPAVIYVSWATTSTAGQCYLTLYNSASPTVGTGFVGVYPINTTTAGGSFAVPLPVTIGGAYSVGLAYAVTTTPTGSTACNTTASSLFVEEWGR